MKYLYELITQDKRGPISLLLKFFLRGCSFIYYLGVSFILLAYKIGIFRRYGLNCVVISVGNITWGGTGKTPLVEMLAGRLDSEGYKAAVLSRGYKKPETSHKSQVTSHKSQVTGDQLPVTCYQSMGDEACFLKKNLPHVHVLVGKDRVATGRKAVKKYGVDTVILDDGFQYWQLSRDLDIITINACCPFGNGQVLPRGILREPISSLKRADIFVITKVDLGNENLAALEEKLRKINSQALIVESVHRPVELYGFDGVKARLEELKGRTVCLVSGIADAVSFEKTVTNLGALVALKFPFPDHYNYQPEDIKKIRDACVERGIGTIITTEKDAVRLSRFKLQALVLRIEIKLTKNEQEFFNRLHSLLDR